VVTACAWAKHGDRISVRSIPIALWRSAPTGFRPGAMGCSGIRYPSPQPTEKLIKTTRPELGKSGPGQLGSHYRAPLPQSFVTHRRGCHT
jgi:hypothetical protein